MILDRHSEFVLAHPPVEGGEGLDVIELGVQEYVLAYPPGTDLPPGPVKLADMPQTPMVFVPRGGSLGDAIEAEIRDAGAYPQIAMLVEHREARMPLVLAGVDGSVVERSVAERAAGRAVVRRCEPSFTLAYGLVFDVAGLSPIGQAFAELARSVHPLADVVDSGPAH